MRHAGDVTMVMGSMRPKPWVIEQEATGGWFMNTSAGLRIGVLGCGYWGSKHARVLQSLENVDQLALIDGRQDRLDNLAPSFPSAPTFTTLAAALPHVDAVVVATPPTTHVP